MIESKIGIIVSSLRLAEIARKVSSRIETHNCTLEKAIPIAKELQARGTEVIVSHGGTAAILEKNISIPVLSLPRSAFELMENVIEATQYAENIGITLYDKPISRLEIFESLFHINIKQIIYHDFETLRIGIIQAKNEGVEIFIGGNATFQVSQEIGCNCILSSRTEDTIADAIEQAKIVASIQRDEKEKTKRVEAILSSVSEGIIAVDENGIIVVFNKAAEDILEMNGAIGSLVNKVAPQLGLQEVLKTGIPKLQSLMKVGGIQIVSNIKSIYLEGKVIGVTASFSEVSRVMKTEQKVRSSYARRFVAKYSVDNIVRESMAMKQVTNQITRFANSDSTILITGESGTGKELVANSIHNCSQRKNGPFVAINCAAVPDENLLKSELFGYDEGAFTGARKGGRMGLFELAHEGTIFLDEIGSISVDLQASLLRVLEQKEIMRVGGDRIIPVDVRVIAATNTDILNGVKEGHIRQDFYFRLNMLRLFISPLRERKEDIPHLVSSFFHFFSRKYGKDLEPLPDELIKRFLDYSWHGNVRELQNFVERFVLMVEKASEYEPTLRTLFDDCGKTEKILRKADETGTSLSEGELYRLFEKSFIKKAEVAKKLGISRTTLWRKLKTTKPVHY